MKAITCPQCGSLIKNILPSQPIADCDYCGAKVVNDRQFFKPEPFDAELAKFRVPPARASVPRTPTQPFFLAIAVVGAFFFLMFVVSFLLSKH